MRVPLLERVERVSLRPVPVTFEVRGAFTRDGHRVDIRGHASSGPNPHAELLPNYVERFLGCARDVPRIAGETLEGAVREAAAAIDLQALRASRLALAEHLVGGALEADLNSLGLRLETLSIDVTDARPAR